MLDTDAGRRLLVAGQGGGCLFSERSRQHLELLHLLKLELEAPRKAPAPDPGAVWDKAGTGLGPL